MKRRTKVHKVMQILSSLSEKELNDRFPQDKEDILRDISTALAHDDEYLDDLAANLLGEDDQQD